MYGVCRFNIVWLWNEIIDWISVSTEIAPKNIWLADKIFIFDWNSAEPQKIRRQCNAWHNFGAAVQGSRQTDRETDRQTVVPRSSLSFMTATNSLWLSLPSPSMSNNWNTTWTTWLLSDWPVHAFTARRNSPTHTARHRDVSWPVQPM